MKDIKKAVQFLSQIANDSSNGLTHAQRVELIKLTINLESEDTKTRKKTIREIAKWFGIAAIELFRFLQDDSS